MTFSQNGPLALSELGEAYGLQPPYKLSETRIYLTVLPEDDRAFMGGFLGMTPEFLSVQSHTFLTYEGQSVELLKDTLLQGSHDPYDDNVTSIMINHVENEIGGQLVSSEEAVTFTPTTVAGGIAQFSYSVENSRGMTEKETVHITVLEAPELIASTQYFHLIQNNGANIPFSALLPDDGDSNENPEMVVSNIIHGSVKGGRAQFDPQQQLIQYTAHDPAGETLSSGFHYLMENTSGEQQTGLARINIRPLPEIDALIYNDSNAAAQKKLEVPLTSEQTFSNMARIASNDYFPDQLSAETNEPPKESAKSWQFQPATEHLSEEYVMTGNFAESLGLISTKEYDKYTIEATLSSETESETELNDNDFIGIIAAYVRDGEKNHILAILFNTGTTDWGTQYRHGCQIYTDFGGALGNPSKFYNSVDVLSSIPQEGWNGNKIRVKVRRDGDIIYFHISDWNQLDSYNPAYEMYLDLNVHEELEKFKGRKPYGYYNFSQGNAHYSDIKFQGGPDLSKIIDVPQNTVWSRAEDTTWQRLEQNVSEYLGPVRKVFNPENNTLFKALPESVVYLGKEVFTGIQSYGDDLTNITLIATDENAANGAAENTQVLVLYAADKEDNNLLAGKPPLFTNSSHLNSPVESQYNLVGQANWFADNGIDLKHHFMPGGTVVFAGGIVGRITAIGNHYDNDPNNPPNNSAFIACQIVDYRLFDKSL